MTTRWMGVALIVAGLAAGAPAWGQQLPFQAPQPQPEPIPYAPPPVGVGPGGPGLAGPGATFPYPGASAGHPEEDCCTGPCQAFHQGCGWYSGIGIMALRRQRLGNTAFAVFDLSNAGDTGIGAPPNAPVAVDFDNLGALFALGGRATLGYRTDCAALEFSGFYLPDDERGVQVIAPGRLDAVFINPPPGFTGTNGLFQQADRIRATFRSGLGNAEINGRWFSNEQPGPQFLLGVRYVDLQERFQIFTDDDSLSRLPRSPARSATYTSRTFNRIVAPQLGIACDKCLCDWLAVGGSLKGAWGVNFVHSDLLLQRGDGLVGLSTDNARTRFSHLYEVGLFVDIHCVDRARLRIGYNFLWLVDVAEAVDQIDYNLANPNGTRNNNGSVFYQGPLIELQLTY